MAKSASFSSPRLTLYIETFATSANLLTSSSHVGCRSLTTAEPPTHASNPRRVRSSAALLSAGPQLSCSRLQLWRRLGALVYLDHAARCPIRRRLGEAPHVARIESQTDDGIATTLLALLDDPTDGVVAARIQHGCEPPKLATGHTLEDHAQAGADVARPHSNAVDCAEDLLDAVAREIHHGCHEVKSKMRH